MSIEKKQIRMLDAKYKQLSTLRDQAVEKMNPASHEDFIAVSKLSMKVSAHSELIKKEFEIKHNVMKRLVESIQ